MPSYLGTDVTTMITSLQAAEQHLRSLNLGPATKQRLDDWVAKTPYQALATATDDIALRNTMQATGSSHIFNRFRGVFEHDALADAAQGGGHALDLYRSLTAWGAFSGAELADYRPIDEEMDIYIAQQDAQAIINAPGSDDAKLANRFNQASKALSEHNPEVAGVLPDLTFDALDTLTDDDNDAFRQTFHALNLRERYLLKTTFAVMAGLHEHTDKLKLTYPLQPYGVVFDDRDAPGFDQNDHSWVEKVKAQRKDFESVLGSYYKIDEVQMTGIGLINEKRNLLGFCFTATRRVAQGLADAFPALRVADYNGARLTPLAASFGLQP